VRLDKTRVVIADFVIGDETGVVKMRLRNGKKLLIEQGKEIKILNKTKKLKIIFFSVEFT